MDRTRPLRRSRSDWPWSGMRARDVATAWSDWATDVADVFDSLLDTMAPQDRRRRHRPRPEGSHDACAGCAPDTCHCDCCVYDADLVVNTRLYERRIVPIRVSNERTRERTITLDLSDFRTSGGTPAPVAGSIVTRTEFTLGACEHEDVLLALTVGAEATGMSENIRYAKAEAMAKVDEADVRDVDDCLVAYADLRIQGCDVRPVRIAVAILPRDCDAYEVHCSCGCC